ncbi:MAG: TetR/AcrR family transcriptional regulator [Solirubrobacteraceae bacterium]
MSQTAASTTAQDEVRRSPRERLLAAAGELFYAEGVQSVGIDRLIERAGVARASLYSTFGSKEGLVRAYLDERHDSILGRRRAAADRAPDPVSAILAVFDSLGRDFKRPDYNGCAFAGARAEEPAGGLVDEATHAYREELRALFRELCVKAGADDPDQLAWQLHLLYSGGAESAKLDHEPGTAAAQRAAAEVLLKAALG